MSEEIKREVRFGHFGHGIYANVVKFGDDFRIGIDLEGDGPMPSSDARLLARLLTFAADECDRLNEPAKPKVRKFKHASASWGGAVMEFGQGSARYVEKNGTSIQCPEHTLAEAEAWVRDGIWVELL